MEEWRKYKLKDFIEFNPKEKVPQGKLCRKISMDQITPFTRFVESNIYEVYKGGAKFRNYDTIMARITPCLENGKTAYISSLHSEEVAVGSTEYIVLRKRENISDSKFIFYLAISPIVRDIAIKSMVGSSGRQRVQQDVLENYEITIPSLPMQKNIAHILSVLDDKIELNKRINDNLEQQAQALFKSWFVDFEPFKKGKFIDSELGMIPEGWQVEELGNITNSITEKVGKRTDIKVLSPVNTGDLLLSEEYFTKQVYSKNLAKYIIVEPNDFAYNPARINIGSIGMNTFDFSGCVSPVYVVFRCEKEYHHFFNIFKATKNFKEEVNTRAIGGVRQTLSYKDFSLIKIVYPPKEAVERFNKIYSHIMTLIKKNVLENKRLHQTRDTLLPKLMSGELKINDINN